MPDPTTVPDLIREAKRLLLLAKRDRHAGPCVTELDAAVYLLFRALGQLGFDAATTPEPVPVVPVVLDPSEPAWRIIAEPAEDSAWPGGLAGRVPSGLAADAEAALAFWWNHKPEWARPPFGGTFRAERVEVAPDETATPAGWVPTVLSSEVAPSQPPPLGTSRTGWEDLGGWSAQPWRRP